MLPADADRPKLKCVAEQISGAVAQTGGLDLDTAGALAASPRPLYCPNRKIPAPVRRTTLRRPLGLAFGPP